MATNDRFVTLTYTYHVKYVINYFVFYLANLILLILKNSKTTLKPQ